MQTVDDFTYDRINKWHRIMLAKAELPAISNQLYEKLPNDDTIYSLEEFIDWVTKTLGLDDPEVIQQAVDQLVNQRKLIRIDKKGITYLRKMINL